MHGDDLIPLLVLLEGERDCHTVRQVEMGRGVDDFLVVFEKAYVSTGSVGAWGRLGHHRRPCVGRDRRSGLGSSGILGWQMMLADLVQRALFDEAGKV